MFTVVPGDGAMSSFSLNCLPIRTQQHWCHESQTTETWSQYRDMPAITINSSATPCSSDGSWQNNCGSLTLRQDVWLHITIVILTSPNKSSRRLQDLSHHVVDETVLIPALHLFKLWLVLPEDISQIFDYMALAWYDSMIIPHQCRTSPSHSPLS